MSEQTLQAFSDVYSASEYKLSTEE